MAKPVKRNRVPKKKINLTDVKPGLYLDEITYGDILPLTEQEASVGGKEYVYEGKLHHGKIAFVGGEGLKEIFPEMEGFNHGFTLEGVAPKIFEVRNALNIYSETEKRLFSYSTKKSELHFLGDPKKVYKLYLRFYDKQNEETTERWAVLYVEEK